MKEYVFNKISLLKGDLYSKIKELLVSAGWKNISSNTITDNDVFYSTGESGQHKLYFQLRPTDSSDKNDITNTIGTIFSIRLINKYTPGAKGVSGTFERTVANEPWRHVMFLQAINITPLDQTIDLYYHVNKNRIVFVTDINSASNQYGNTIFIGMSDQNMIREINSRGVVFSVNGYGASPGRLSVLATSASYRDAPSSITHNILSNLAPTTINSSNKVMISDLVFGDSSEGMRGLIDGIFIIKSGKAQHGDILIDGVKKYKVFYQPSPSGSNWSYAYPSEHVVIRIE